MGRRKPQKFCTKGNHFVDRSKFYKQKRSSDGLQVWCAECYRQHKRDLYWEDSEAGARRREYERFKAIHRRYGITRETYETMLELQEYKCGVCFEDLPTDTRHIHLDHEHSTGRVRGILCSTCNKGIGFFKDSPDFLYNAMRYLERFTQHYGEDILLDGEY